MLLNANQQDLREESNNIGLRTVMPSHWLIPASVPPQYNVQLAEERWVHMKSLVISLYPRACVSPLPVCNRNGCGVGQEVNQEAVFNIHMTLLSPQGRCYIHIIISLLLLLGYSSSSSYYYY